MKDLAFALNAVLPIFALVALGFVGGKRGSIPQPLRASLGPFVFKFCMPALVFDSIYGSDFSTAFSPGLSVFLVAASLLSLGLAALFSRLMAEEGAIRGSFIQGCFRGNYVILSLPLIGEVFGAEGRAEAAILLTFIFPLYNLGSILVLALHSRNREGRNLGSLLLSLVNNPLLLSLAAALPFALVHVSLPPFLTRSIDYLAAMAVPLALIDVGGSMARRRRGGRGKAIAFAVAWKLLLTPLLFVLGARALGFAGRELGIAYLVGAAPTAVVSYTMACSMGCDEETAGGIVVWSTFAALPGYLVGIWILRGAGIA